MTTDVNESGVFSSIKDEMISALDRGFSALESEQSKINKAVFDALSMEQRDSYCKSLESNGVKAKRIEKITGKSQPTINRHLNNKNS